MMLFKNHKGTQIQRQRQWQRERQRQRPHKQSAWNTQHMLYFWNPNDSLIPYKMIDTSPLSSCSRRSSRSPCSGHRIISTGPSVSPFQDFSQSTESSNAGVDGEDADEYKCKAVTEEEFSATQALLARCASHQEARGKSHQAGPPPSEPPKSRLDKSNLNASENTSPATKSLSR